MNNILSHTTERLKSIDALRGFAVILMLEQHLGPWLWKHPWTNLIKLLSQHKIFMTINGMGGFAAPLFVTLSGIGASYLVNKYTNPDKKLLMRGMFIILLGYLLNILTPGWFSLGSWYILHMIGFGLTAMPVLRRLPSPALLTTFVIIILSTVFIQLAFNSPSRFSNTYMANYGTLVGIIKLALAEGNFPIFPWLSFFIAGMISGKWIINRVKKNILILAGFSFGSGVILILPGALGFGFATSGLFARMFKFYPGYNPPFPPIILLLISLSLFVIYLAIIFEKKYTIKNTNFMVCLGQSSLTILFAHIIVFKQWSIYCNFYKIFTKTETVFGSVAIILIFSLLAKQWKKVNFKYGLEWALRKIS